MNVIMVGSANTQEAVLAINVLMTFDSTKDHRLLLMQLLLKLTYLQCRLAPNFMA